MVHVRHARTDPSSEDPRTDDVSLPVSSSGTRLVAGDLESGTVGVATHRTHAPARNVDAATGDVDTTSGGLFRNFASCGDHTTGNRTR